MRRQASREHPIQQKFPPSTLNNTTVNTLGNTDATIEVFPPEIFFKGKSLFHSSIRGFTSGFLI